jgi:regulator of RNase E activity RraA
MPYSIDRYSGTTPVVVEDGTIDSTFDIKLIGKNYAGYGEVQNENFLHLLENFAGTGEPPRKIAGQIWFDSGTNKLKFYDGSQFRATGGAEIGSNTPSGLTTGDFWFDSNNSQLYAKAESGEFVLIGPQTAPGLNTTQMNSRTVIDDISDPHAIVEAIVDGTTVFIISSDEFTLDSGENPITGFTDIKKGVTLINTSGTTGITSTAYRFWGTSSHATKAGSVDVSGTARTAATTATANTIAARDGSGDLYATVFQGVASTARFADLAEKYLADAEYAPGTVMVVGGEKEVTASSWGKRAIGAVSTNPAYMMNSELEGGTYVALKGRVPVRVVGAVKKGDNLIAANDGCASVGVHHSTDVFAVALESSNDTGVKLIEAIIL